MYSQQITVDSIDNSLPVGCLIKSKPQKSFTSGFTGNPMEDFNRIIIGICSRINVVILWCIHLTENINYLLIYFGDLINNYIPS